MGDAAAKIIEEALELPEAEREEVIDALVASLPKPAADTALVEEIHRRMGEVRSGTVKPIPWSEARERLRQKR